MKPVLLNETPTHPACDQLLDDAERSLEQHNYATAVADFRAAALLAPLGQDALFNLSVAEDGERIKFRRLLSHKFPESFDLAMAEVETLIQAKFGQQAVARCTALLEGFDLTPQQVISIRHTRLRAAKDRDHTSFATDFISLWGGSIDLKFASRMRLMLLRILIEIGSPSMLPALMLIRDQVGHETELTKIIDGKFDQLKDLQRLKSLDLTYQSP